MFVRFALAVCSLALPFAAVAPLGAQNPLARAKAKAQHPFVGQYAGGGTRLELTWDDDKGRYAGTLTAGDAKCPVEAAEKGEVLEGAFRSDGTRYTFTLRARGAKFVLTSDGEDHELERQNAGDTPAPAPAPAKPAAGGQGGVGIAFRPDGGKLVVAQLAPDSAAAKAKVPVGAVLRAIDGKRVDGMELDAVPNLVRGPIGTFVTLTLKTDKEVLDVVLQRAPLPGAPGANPAPGTDPAPGRNDQPGAAPGGNAPGGNVPGGDAPIAPAPGGGNGVLPAWMKPGVRATYFSGSASIPGSAAQLVEDDDGNWVDDQGRRYRQDQIEGSGGAGFSEYDFVHVTPEVIAVSSTSYVFADAQLQTVTRVGHQGYVGDQNGLGDVWIPPAKLRAMPLDETRGHRVRRVRYPLGGHVYDAITVQTSAPGSYIRYTYDLDTGLMIVHSSSSIGKGVIAPNANGTASPGAGATMITHGHLRNLRELKLPWIGQRAPGWLKQGQEWRYPGSCRNSVAEGVVAPWRYEFSVAVTRTFGDGMLARLGTLLDYGYGQQPQQSQSENAYGPGSPLNLWLDPRAVQNLRQGQVLDRDPVTNWQIAFGGSDGRTATLLEQGPLDTQSYVYDLRSGQLVASTVRKQQGPATLTFEVQLAR